MLHRKLAAAIVASGVVGLASLSLAQQPSGQGRQGTAESGQSTSLFGELENFGRSLFGDTAPERSRPATPAPAKPTVGKSHARLGPTRPGSAPASRAGSVVAPDSFRDDAEVTDVVPRPVVGSRAGMATTVRRTADSGASVRGRSAAVPTEPAESSDADDAAVTAPKKKAAAAAAAQPDVRTLHERLSATRQSAFEQGNSGRAKPRPSANSASDPPVIAPTRASPSVGLTPATSTRVPVAAAPPPVETGRSPGAPTAGRPTILQRAAPSGIDSSTPAAQAQPRLATRPETGAKPETVARPETLARPGAVAKSKENVLIARKSPVIGVETVGPRKIMVGRESVYEVTVVNSGEVAADELVVLVGLPAWADVLSAEATVGNTHAPAAGDAARQFQWKVGQLAAAGREKVALRIVPRESRPFDLAVRWDYKPVASQAMIEVQEPKLAMYLEGPRDVLYGKREVFTLRLANTGNGDAEDVVITLLPVGAGENQPATHKIGVLAAGEQKVIEVEITARQAGELQIRVEARGEGGVHAEVVDKVLVRRAALQVDVDGPQVQYVGAAAAYRIRVANPGSAPARHVRLTAIIPPEGKYLSGIEGSQLEADGAKVQWTVDTLAPTVEQVFVMKCSVGRPGAAKVEVTAAAEDDLSASGAAAIRVEAMADLVLEVKDPGRPVPLGEDATYELRIHNRGTKAAEGVEVLAFFSRGVEPVSVEGGQHRLAPGQVVFQPIASVAPSADLVLKIRAKAETAGNHVFRAEVQCKPLGTRLASEQTTHFYQDGATPQQPATRPATAVSEVPPAQLPRTVDRRESIPTPTRGDLPLSPLQR